MSGYRDSKMRGYHPRHAVPTVGKVVSSVAEHCGVFSLPPAVYPWPHRTEWGKS